MRIFPKKHFLSTALTCIALFLIVLPATGMEAHLQDVVEDGKDGGTPYLLAMPGTVSRAFTVPAGCAGAGVTPDSSAWCSQKPDLAVTGLTIPETVDEQSAFNISFDVRNQGSAYSGDIRCDIEGRGDILLLSDFIKLEGLSPGENRSVTAVLFADVLVAARDNFTVTVTVEPLAGTADADYRNNAANGTCIVVGGPEFAVSGLSVPPFVVEGEAVEISFCVKNYGTNASGDVGWEVRIQDENFVKDDVVLTGALGALEEEHNATVTTLWNTTPGDAGEYVISAWVTTHDDESDDNEAFCECLVTPLADLSRQ
jgi:hypothetical protein